MVHWAPKCLLAVMSILPIVGCGGGSGSTPSTITVTVSPSSATLVPGAQQHFSAAVSATNQAVIWQVDGGTGGNATLGRIDSTGRYVAPATIPKPPRVTISAVAQAGG